MIEELALPRAQRPQGNCIIADLTGTKVLVIPLIAVVGSTPSAIVAIITNHDRKNQHDEMGTTPKQQLIERGMTVDDIERVPKAKTESANAGSTR